jgi:hypothetical protein
LKIKKHFQISYTPSQNPTTNTTDTLTIPLVCKTPIESTGVTVTAGTSEGVAGVTAGTSEGVAEGGLSPPFPRLPSHNSFTPVGYFDASGKIVPDGGWQLVIGTVLKDPNSLSQFGVVGVPPFGEVTLFVRPKFPSLKLTTGASDLCNIPRVGEHQIGRAHV